MFHSRTGKIFLGIALVSALLLGLLIWSSQSSQPGQTTTLSPIVTSSATPAPDTAALAMLPPGYTLEFKYSGGSSYPFPAHIDGDQINIIAEPALDPAGKAVIVWKNLDGPYKVQIVALVSDLNPDHPSQATITIDCHRLTFSVFVDPSGKKGTFGVAESNACKSE